MRSTHGGFGIFGGFSALQRSYVLINEQPIKE